VTGVYALEAKAQNGASLYRNVNNYTVNSSGVWEYKTITIDALTAITPASDSSLGLALEFWLDDSDGAYNGSSSAFETWVDGSTTTNGARAYGQTAQILSAASNYWQITGFQLEVGDTATPFEHRSYGDELARCQRYFIDPASATSLGTSAATFSSLNTGATVDSTASVYLLPVVLPVTMRADPTVTLGSGTLGVYTSLNTNSFGRRACNISIAQNICPTGFVVKAQDNVDTAHCGIRGWWICDAEL
jgi:hypothetical protein